MREPIKCLTCGQRYYEGERHSCIPSLTWDDRLWLTRETFLVEENVRLKAEVESLRDALNAVEWYTEGHDHDEIGVCPWCHWNENIGHAKDCMRQRVLWLAS